MIGKEPILEMKTVNQFFGGATAEQARAVAGKRDPVESFFEWDIGYDRFGHQIHHHDSVMAVSRMQDRSETALGMHGNIDGEIAQFDLSYPQGVMTTGLARVQSRRPIWPGSWTCFRLSSAVEPIALVRRITVANASVRIEFLRFY